MALSDGFRKVFSIDRVGDFMLRRPSMTDQIGIARQRISMLGSDVNDNTPEWTFAQTIAIINVTAESKPAGFDWTKVYFEDRAWSAFYRAYSEWLDSFRPVDAPDIPTDQGVGAH